MTASVVNYKIVARLYYRHVSVKYMFCLTLDNIGELEKGVVVHRNHLQLIMMDKNDLFLGYSIAYLVPIYFFSVF